MVHRHKTFFKKTRNGISHFCYRLLTNLLVRSLWWSIHSVDHQYSSGFIGGPTPLPAGKPKTKGVLLVCYNTIQERMRIRQFNTHIGLILMVIPLKLFLEISWKFPLKVKMREKPRGLSNWVNFAARDWLLLDTPEISETGSELKIT